MEFFIEKQQQSENANDNSWRDLYLEDKIGAKKKRPILKISWSLSQTKQTAKSFSILKLGLKPKLNIHPPADTKKGEAINCLLLLISMTANYAMVMISLKKMKKKKPPPNIFITWPENSPIPWSISIQRISSEPVRFPCHFILFWREKPLPYVNGC